MGLRTTVSGFENQSEASGLTAEGKQKALSVFKLKRQRLTPTLGGIRPGAEAVRGPHHAPSAFSHPHSQVTQPNEEATIPLWFRFSTPRASRFWNYPSLGLHSYPLYTRQTNSSPGWGVPATRGHCGWWAGGMSNLGGFS